MRGLKSINPKLLIVPPVLAGIIFASIVLAAKPDPPKRPSSEVERVLRVISVPNVPFVARTIGYGSAAPGQTWRAISEVRGRVVFVDAALESGSMVAKGTRLLGIDPTEYELSVAKLKANAEEVKAQLVELEAESGNTDASLKIEQRSLTLAKRSLERKRKALERNAIPADEVDREERNVLVQEQTIQSLVNTKRLLPAKRASLNASLAVINANLAQAELDLTKVSIVAPFDCRIAEVDIQEGQFLAGGQTLFEAHGTAVTEVTTKLAIHQVRNLLPRTDNGSFHAFMTPDQLQKAFNLDVIVRLRTGGMAAEWEARFARIREQTDQATRSHSIVVAVDNPYGKIIIGKRPPLTKGMYCEVELRSASRPNAIVIPRSALHADHVFVLDDDDRLVRKPVKVRFEQSGLAVIEEGLQEGQTLVVSDPTPAIDGMLVKAVKDAELQAKVIADAAAEIPIQ